MDLTLIQLRQHKVLTFACTEMIRNMSGRLNWITSYQADLLENSCLIVGTWDDARRVGLLPKDIEQEEHEDAYLMAPLASSVLLLGNTERSTLFAVYDYLQRTEGLMAVYPHEWTLGSVEGLQHVTIEKPRFRRRGFVFETINEPAYIRSMIDWLAKNRVSEVFFTFTLWESLKEEIEPELQKRGMLLTLGGHSMRFFLDTDRTASPKDHPYHTKVQLDYTDESWYASFMQRLISYCTEIPALRRISLWPEDVAVQTDAEFLSIYIRFTERIKAALLEAGMDIEVEHIAYNAGLSWKMLELQHADSSKDVDTLFAYWGRDYRYSLSRQEEGPDQRAWNSLKHWREGTSAKRKECTVFEYYSDHYMLSFLFPILAQRIRYDLDDYEARQIDGLLNLVVPFVAKNDPVAYRVDESYDWRWAHGCNSYFFARMSWGDAFDNTMAHYLQVFPPQYREAVQLTLMKLEELVSPLTSYNIPLFPIRAVDPEKRVAAGEISKELRVAILDSLRSVQSLASMLDLELETNSTELNQLKRVVRSLSEGAKHIETQWGETDEI